MPEYVNIIVLNDKKKKKKTQTESYQKYPDLAH